MWVLDVVLVISVLAAVVAFPVMLIGWANNPVKSVLVFAVPVLIGALASGIGTLIEDCEVAEFLNAVSSQCSVSVDGHTVQNRDAILDAVRGRSGLPAHHSSPERILHVDISDPPRDLRLWLARDSSDPREYWVFVPRSSKLAHRISLKTDIGHIKTSVFDGY